ncbi:MAG: Gfo/Idh/MocA family oxidoreductase [Vicinamibacteria bacterium]|nr:Gfo/Idh/MocA family oxidoreductase [Vicinamibacteria bacterium]
MGPYGRTVSGRCVRAGVVGVGALGRHHARIYAALDDVQLTGVCDVRPERARGVAAEHGCPAFDRPEQLLPEVDLVSIAVPTTEHHRLARVFLEAGKDVLVEKPITSTTAEAADLISIATRRQLILQVGHVERFNPAVNALFSSGVRPRFIEVHRLASFSPRSLDIDVVLDLMIHDLDILLVLEDSEILQIDAVGVPVLTNKVDIANARLRFASGLIANLTASRVSAERMRKFRVFSNRCYVSLDLLARRVRVFRLEGEPGRPKLLEERHEADDSEPLERQIAAFVDSVRNRTQPVVDGRTGERVLGLAQAICERMSGALQTASW